jgi:hypothetical protein
VERISILSKSIKKTLNHFSHMRFLHLRPFLSKIPSCQGPRSLSCPSCQVSQVAKSKPVRRPFLNPTTNRSKKTFCPPAVPNRVGEGVYKRLENPPKQSGRRRLLLLWLLCGW